MNDQIDYIGPYRMKSKIPSVVYSPNLPEIRVRDHREVGALTSRWWREVIPATFAFQTFLACHLAPSFGI